MVRQALSSCPWDSSQKQFVLKPASALRAAGLVFSTQIMLADPGNPHLTDPSSPDIRCHGVRGVQSGFIRANAGAVNPPDSSANAWEGLAVCHFKAHCVMVTQLSRGWLIYILRRCFQATVLAISMPTLYGDSRECMRSHGLAVHHAILDPIEQGP